MENILKYWRLVKSGVGFDYRMINMKVGFATSNGKKSIKLPTVAGSQTPTLTTDLIDVVKRTIATYCDWKYPSILSEGALKIGENTFQLDG